MKKLIMSAALVAAMFFTGCGVDEARLAQLTGDKNFDQVKESYKKAVFYDKKEDVEVYKYYLTKNADKVTGFDFEMYAKKIDQDNSDMYAKTQEQLKKFKDNLSKITYTQLKQELSMGAFMMGQAKAIDDYVKGIETLMKEKNELDKAAKKAEKRADEERYINSLSPEQREKYLQKKESEQKRQALRDAAAATKQNNNVEIK
jgi:hypothetical protein